MNPLTPLLVGVSAAGCLAAQVLNITDPRPQPGGNRYASFYGLGPDDPPQGPQRTTLAYHWGLMTSGSPRQALWLLLLPFRVVGIAVGGALELVWAIVTLPARVIRALV